VRSRHSCHVDWFPVLASSLGRAATVVSEAVLHTNDNPAETVSRTNLHMRRWQCVYHKFVKTTPNPKATKKSSGELVGPPPPLLPLLELLTGLFAFALLVLASAEETVDDIVGLL
jgi:hypothetical protein